MKLQVCGIYEFSRQKKQKAKENRKPQGNVNKDRKILSFQQYLDNALSNTYA